MDCKTCGRETDRACATCGDPVCELHLITHKFGRSADDVLEIEVCEECDRKSGEVKKTTPGQSASLA